MYIGYLVQGLAELAVRHWTALHFATYMSSNLHNAELTLHPNSQGAPTELFLNAYMHIRVWLALCLPILKTLFQALRAMGTHMKLKLQERKESTFNRIMSISEYFMPLSRIGTSLKRQTKTKQKTNKNNNNKNYTFRN